MNSTITFKTIWHTSGIPGLVLAAISTAYFLSDYALSSLGSVWTTALNLVLEVAKIVACIWLMKIFLTRFADENENATKNDVKKLGTMIALLSALIFSACQMAFYIWHPEIAQEAFDMIFQKMGASLDANSIAVIDKMQEDFPRFVFFGNLIYCFLFGWILTAILAPRILPDNPFSDDSRDKWSQDGDNDTENE